MGKKRRKKVCIEGQGSDSVTRRARKHHDNKPRQVVPCSALASSVNRKCLTNQTCLTLSFNYSRWLAIPNPPYDIRKLCVCNYGLPFGFYFVGFSFRRGWWYMKKSERELMKMIIIIHISSRRPWKCKSNLLFLC